MMNLRKYLLSLVFKLPPSEAKKEKKNLKWGVNKLHPQWKAIFKCPSGSTFLLNKGSNKKDCRIHYRRDKNGTSAYKLTSLQLVPLTAQRKPQLLKPYQDPSSF